MPEYNYSKVNLLWEEETPEKKEFNVVRKLTQKESENALNFWNVTRHFKERVQRLWSSGMGIGMVASGFLVDKGHENGLEKHYITSTGLIIIRNFNTDKAITVLVARPEQVERYFDALGHVVHSKIVKIAKRNKERRLNY